MAGHGGPDIITDGLVFCLDAADKVSYQGEPTTNLAPYPFNGDATGTETGTWGSTDGSWTPNSGSIVQMVDPFGTTRNVIEYTNHASGHFYGQPSYLTGLSANSVTLATGSYYVSAYFKASSAITTGNILYRKGASGNSSMGDVTITTEWTRIGRTFEVTTAGGHYFRHYSYSVPSNWNLWVTGLQIEAKSHATPFVNGTRSATDGWKDLTGNGNHGDLTNMTFDSDAQMDFDGSSGYISFSSTDYGIAAEWTVSWWMNMDDDGLQTFFSMKEAGSNNKIEFITNNTIREIFANLLDHDGTVIQVDTDNTVWSTGEWTHVAITNNGGTATSSAISFYINGEAKSNNVVNGATITPMEAGSRTLSIGKEDGGSRYVDGKITAVHVYNCALSAKEVSQNFNAKRSRFGV